MVFAETSLPLTANTMTEATSDAGLRAQAVEDGWRSRDPLRQAAGTRARRPSASCSIQHDLRARRLPAQRLPVAECKRRARRKAGERVSILKSLGKLADVSENDRP